MIQSEDIKIRLTLTDGTSAILPSSLDSYSVVVYYIASGKKTVIATFSSEESGLYGITVYDNAAGKIDVVLNRDVTAKIPPSKVYAEVFIKETASAEYISNLAKNGASDIHLFDIEAAAKTNSI